MRIGTTNTLHNIFNASETQSLEILSSMETIVLHTLPLTEERLLLKFVNETEQIEQVIFVIPNNILKMYISSA